MKLFSKILTLSLVATAFLPFANASAKEWNEDYQEYTFTVTYDFNGGATFDGKETLERSGLVAYGPNLDEAYLLSCVDFAKLDNDEIECHPADVKKGKQLSYVTVNGERHDLGEDDGYVLNDDTTIVYYWTDLDLEEYADIADANGNDISVSFDEEDGHTFRFFANQFSFNMTDEELEKIETTREDYEAGKAAITGAVKDYGEVVFYYDFWVEDEDNRPISEGPFKLKIKFTEEMGNYDVYKLVYVDADEEGNVLEVGEPIVLTLEDGYLVGTVPHFSGYALVGATAEEEDDSIKSPNTGASIVETGSGSASLVSVVLASLTSVGVASILLGAKSRR